MVKLLVTYTGELHCLLRHQPSGAIIETDAPVDNQGKGEAFSPTDLLAAALASCIATVIAIYAERQQLEVSGMRVEIDKTMQTQPSRRIGTLAVAVWMPQQLLEQQRQAIEKVARTCPVHQSLHPDIDISIAFHWPSSPHSSPTALIS